MARRNKAVYKTIRGVRHKLCTGPAHREGKFVPVSNFFLRGDGTKLPRPQCKHCESITQGAEQMVPISEIRFALDELIFRLGKAETARRIGVKPATMWEWTKGHRHHMHRRNARKIISLLAEARANNEARHKKSIKHGASARGKQERVPTKSMDFNGPNAHKNEVKKKWLKKQPQDEIQKRWRETKRRQSAQRRAKLTEAA